MKNLEESNSKDRRESMKKIAELDYNYKNQKQELDEKKQELNKKDKNEMKKIKILKS